MKYYEYYKYLGICPRCRTYKPVKGKVYCPNCNDWKSIYNMRRRATETEEERQGRLDKQRKYSHRRYEERKAKGICTACGKRKPPEGRRQCKVCVEKSAAINRQRYYAKKEGEE